MPTIGALPGAKRRSISSRAPLSPEQLQLILKIASVNPLYDKSPQRVVERESHHGTDAVTAELANLARLRFVAPDGKYVVVDSNSARLYMLDEHGIANSMRIIVGKPETPTPLLVSVIYYATANPYWNVPDNLIRSLVAARVLTRGKAYLTDHNYRVVTKLSPDADEVPKDERRLGRRCSRQTPRSSCASYRGRTIRWAS